MVLIRPETAEDLDVIDEVNRLAFGSETEVQHVRDLRNGNYAVLSLVADVAGEIVGHCMFSRMSLGDSPAIALGPVAILPEHQRQGIGKKLIEQGLRTCKEQGHERVIVLGHAEYYPKFGFSAELTKNIDHPFSPDTFMALELVPGAMNCVQGRAIYPPPFGID